MITKNHKNNLLTMMAKKYCVAQRCIKNYFAPCFNSKKKEVGVTVTIGTIGLIVTGVVALLAVAAGGAAVYYNWEAIAKNTVGAVLYLMVGLSRGCAVFSAQIFDSIAGSGALQKTITQNKTVLEGWRIVRDFANMFVVLGFVVVGLATILRIREYEAQKTLIPLIIVALLINFSLLFCGIIIDATNIAMAYFTQISGPGGVTQPFLVAINDPETVNYVYNLYNNGGFANFDFIAAAAGYSISAFVAAMIFFIYGILFIFRYVALMCLVTLSPLGFVCYIFPATKPIFKKWWEQFFQWAIIGIPASFFIYLAGHLLVDLGLNKANPASGASFAFFVPAGFLLFAYSLIFQTSAIGASAAIGLATGAVGYARGAVKWGGGKALRGAASITGASRFGNAVKNKATSALEAARLLPKGYTAQSQQKELEPSKKRAKAMTTDELVAGANRRSYTRQAKLDEAAFAEELANRNQLGRLDVGRRESIMARAVASGIDKNVFTKSKPEYMAGATDAEATQKIKYNMAQQFQSGGALTSEDAWNQVKNYSPNANELATAKEELRGRKIMENALGVAPLTDKDVTNKLTEKKHKELTDGGMTHEQASEEIKRTGYKPAEHEMALARETFAAENIQKAVKKMAPRKAAELPTEAVSPETISALSENQFNEGVAKFGSQGLIDEFKKYAAGGSKFQATQDYHNKLISQGKTAEAAELRQKTMRTIPGL